MKLEGEQVTGMSRLFILWKKGLTKVDVMDLPAPQAREFLAISDGFDAGRSGDGDDIIQMIRRLVGIS